MTAVTGMDAGIMGAVILVGGGAFAGAFANLIFSNGYDQESNDNYKQAILRGQIIVGVEARNDSLPLDVYVAQSVFDEARQAP